MEFLMILRGVEFSPAHLLSRYSRAPAEIPHALHHGSLTAFLTLLAMISSFN